MIKINQLTKQYPAFKLQIEQMDIQPNCITGLVGANGSGKTTLFRLIAGLARPTSGQAEIFNTNVWDLPIAFKQKIGVVFNASGYPETLMVSDIQKIQAAFYPRFEAERFNTLIRRFNLPDNLPIAKFSTGMAARLKIICALTHQAELLLLDEPTNGLDIIARQEIHELLQEYMETPGRAIVISSHIASDLEKLCDDFWMIHKGKIQLHETVDALQNEYGILNISENQFELLDKQAALGYLKTPGGYQVLVNDRKFYQENYPGIRIDKGNIDDLMLIIEKGDAL